MRITFSEILLEIYTFSFKENLKIVVWKKAAILARPQFVTAILFILRMQSVLHLASAGYISDINKIKLGRIKDMEE